MAGGFARDRERQLVFGQGGQDAEVVLLTDDTTGIPKRSDASGTVKKPRYLYVGVSGDLTVDMAERDGNSPATGILFKAVPVGKLDIAVSKVWKTGTTATNILFLY